MSLENKTIKTGGEASYHIEGCPLSATQRRGLTGWSFGVRETPTLEASILPVWTSKGSGTHDRPILGPRGVHPCLTVRVYKRQVTRGAKQLYEGSHLAGESETPRGGRSTYPPYLWLCSEGIAKVRKNSRLKKKPIYSPPESTQEAFSYVRLGGGTIRI
jgi:hypothetical protein